MKACGKIILFGEHAVVYGKPGIAVPILDYYTKVTIDYSDTLTYSADRVLFDHEKDKLHDLLELLLFNLKIPKETHIKIESTLPISSGLGSSASLSIALIRAFSDHFHLDLTDEKINKLAFDCEKLFHGTPSGIDNTVVTYQKPVFFQSGVTDFIKLKQPISLVIANTGIKPPTKAIIAELKQRYEQDKDKYLRIFDKIGAITKEARTCLEKGEIPKLGELMTENHNLLKSLKLSNGTLNLLCEIALQNGAYGAKLVGAGRGGNIVALVDNNHKKQVMNELKVMSKQVIFTEVK